MDSITVRLKHRISQKQLAYLLGVSRCTVSRWEIGISSPEVHHIRMMKMLHDTPRIQTDALDTFMLKGVTPLVVHPDLA